MGERIQTLVVEELKADLQSFHMTMQRTGQCSGQFMECLSAIYVEDSRSPPTPPQSVTEQPELECLHRVHAQELIDVASCAGPVQNTGRYQMN
ncbi:hypothetical protein BSKO_01544 [Bryopsis sp. KO-2023]|nr:hypothetical protein BSKO_01544 [Bryopsis sp. KO-2023]